MGVSGKLAAALRTARLAIEAANTGCPYGSYRSYDCSPIGVVMPDRITPVEHSEISSLFAGACICNKCRADHRGAAFAGKPLVLYHGTSETGIGQLEAGPGKYQRVAGIYLSKSRAEAEKYTKIDGVKHPENVLTVRAYLRNPATRKVLDELGHRLDGDQMQAELIRRGYDSVIDKLMDEVIVFDPRQLVIVNDAQVGVGNV